MALTAVPAGCGGGSSDSTAGEASSGATTQSSSEAGSSQQLSKAAFVEKANGACGEQREGGIERLNAYASKHSSEGLSKDELNEAAYKAVLITTIQAELDALRELGVPSEGGKQVEAFLAGEQAALDKAKQRRDSISSGQLENYFTPTDKMLRAFGLTGCTKSS